MLFGLTLPPFGLYVNVYLFLVYLYVTVVLPSAFIVTSCFSGAVNPS